MTPSPAEQPRWLWSMHGEQKAVRRGHGLDPTAAKGVTVRYLVKFLSEKGGQMLEPGMGMW